MTSLVGSNSQQTTYVDQKHARFVQQLEEIDKLFEDAREWADLSKCLNKIKQAIEKHPNQHVPMKKMLAKRLA